MKISRQNKCNVSICKDMAKYAGFCGRHYSRKWTGRPLINSREQFYIDNPPTDDIALIPLSQVQVAIIDKSDFEIVSAYIWSAVKLPNNCGYYACTHFIDENNKMLSMNMAAFLLGTRGKEVVADHIDGNGLNNRRENLRIATKAQNGMNKRRFMKGTSTFRGVRFDKTRKKWRAEISIHDYPKFLGRFDSEVEAARAYDAAAQSAYGEFANLNFKIPRPKSCKR